jgi:hypothetical protein
MRRDFQPHLSANNLHPCFLSAVKVFWKVFNLHCFGLKSKRKCFRAKTDAEKTEMGGWGTSRCDQHQKENLGRE